jgi:hypothetical protein
LPIAREEKIYAGYHGVIIVAWAALPAQKAILRGSTPISARKI